VWVWSSGNNFIPRLDRGKDMSVRLYMFQLAPLTISTH
jgi:hypothetical protein